MVHPLYSMVEVKLCYNLLLTSLPCSYYMLAASASRWCLNYVPAHTEVSSTKALSLIRRWYKLSDIPEVPVANYKAHLLSGSRTTYLLSLVEHLKIQAGALVLLAHDWKFNATFSPNLTVGQTPDGGERPIAGGTSLKEAWIAVARGHMDNGDISSAETPEHVDICWLVHRGAPEESQCMVIGCQDVASNKKLWRQCQKLHGTRTIPLYR
jgi:hypothetical protein